MGLYHLLTAVRSLYKLPLVGREGFVIDLVSGECVSSMVRCGIAHEQFRHVHTITTSQSFPTTDCLSWLPFMLSVFPNSCCFEKMVFSSTQAAMIFYIPSTMNFDPHTKPARSEKCTLRPAQRRIPHGKSDFPTRKRSQNLFVHAESHVAFFA